MSSLFAIILLALFVLAFGGGILFVASKLGPKRDPDPVKGMPYECGVIGEETKDSNVSVKFYLTAILFILFDIEIIFMYPWAVTFIDFLKQGMGLYVLGSMGFFVLLFILGLLWEVKSRALEWD
jgi:NADH-quinone oxidoreductase subunit A